METPNKICTELFALAAAFRLLAGQCGDAERSDDLIALTEAMESIADRLVIALADAQQETAGISRSGLCRKLLRWCRA